MNIPIFLDVESTGFDEPIRLVQLAYSLGKGDHYNDFFNPQKDIEFGAMAVCHITNEMVADKMLFEKSNAKKDLSQILKDDILVAHNAPYDIGVLKNEGVETVKYIDTMRVAQHLLDYEGGYSMQELRYALGLTFDKEINPHDALDDIIVLEALFWFLMKELHGIGSQEERIAHMQALSQQPVMLKKITFGQYGPNGKNAKKEGCYTWGDIAEIDRGYLTYLYDSEMEKEKEDRNQNLMATLEHHLKIDE